jgi:type I restriction enzyme S subunit
MKSRYDTLGKYIRTVDVRNSAGTEENLLGVTTQKYFMPSIANTVGTEFSKYKVVRKGQFTYVPDTSRRGDRIAIALLQDWDEGLVSNIYTVFEVADEEKLLPEYLMLWFKRSEFDRYARFKSHGSVREIFAWDEMCKVELPVPDIEVQRSIVRAYNMIEMRIRHLRQLNDNLSGGELRHTQLGKGFKLANFLLNLRLRCKNRLAILRKPLCEFLGRQGNDNGFKYAARNLHKRSAGCVAFKGSLVLFKEVVNKGCSYVSFGNNRLKPLISAKLCFCDSYHANWCA